MLEELKQRVWQVAQDSMKEGLVHELGGNFSIYDHKSGYVVISPGGVYRAVLKPEHIAVVDLDGKVVEGSMKPSSETPMHTGIYKALPDIGGIVHTHSTYATVFAVLNREIPCFVIESMMCKPGIPVARFAQPGTQDMADALVPHLKRGPAVFLRNHGMLTIGKTVEEAFIKSVYVEEIATVYHHCLQIGTPVAFTDEQIYAFEHRHDKK